MTNKEGSSDKDAQSQANEPEFDSTPEEIVMVTNDYKPKPSEGAEILNEKTKK